MPTPTFSLSDPIFNQVRSVISQSTIDLINASPLLQSLLQDFSSRERILRLGAPESGGFYRTEDGKPLINITQDWFAEPTIATNGFVSTLAHELGHDAWRELSASASVGDGFRYSIQRESNEASATAVSYVVSRQIRATTGVEVEMGLDVGVANTLTATQLADLDVRVFPTLPFGTADVTLVTPCVRLVVASEI